MRVQYEPPTAADASGHAVVTEGPVPVVSFQPHVRPGQTALLVGYLHAIGAQGAKAMGRITFNPRSGRFQVQDISRPATTCDFDKPVEEVAATQALCVRGRPRTASAGKRSAKLVVDTPGDVATDATADAAGRVQERVHG